MKKYLISIIIFLIATIGIFNFVNANDGGGPNPLFWMKHNKITCVSIVDPENINKDFFLVFDYSFNVGEKLGKPWTIIEKGKCYEIDETGGDIYRVQLINGNERKLFENYNAFKVTDNISRMFCMYEDVGDCDLPVVFPLTDSLFLDAFFAPVLDSQDIILDTGIRADEVFLTKYDFPDELSYDGPGEEENPVPLFRKNLSYIQATTIYEFLAKDLQNRLRQCDNRIRVEYQIVVSPADNKFLELKDIIWRLNNGKDLSFRAAGFNSFGRNNMDSLERIDLMGCKSEFSDYINSHKTDFDILDKLGDEIIKKYPDAVIKRNPSIINKILSFAVGAEIETSSSSTEPVVSTTLDEPTSKKKLDILFNSSNPLMRMYVLLPLIALIGIAIFFFIKKRKKDVY